MLKLLQYMKPYWKFAVLAPLLMMVEVIADIAQPDLMAKIVDEGVRQGNLDVVIRYGAIMVGVATIGLMGGLGCMVTSTIAGTGFGTDLRSRVYEKIQEFSFTNIDKFKTSSLITRLTNDINQVQMLTMMFMRMLVRAPFHCIGGLVMAIAINPKLSLILVVAVPLLVISLSVVIRKGFPLFQVVQQKLDKVNAVMRENLSGVRVIKAFVRSDYEKNRFEEANEELVRISLSASRLVILFQPIMMLIMNISVICVLWFGGYQYSTGSIEIGEIMAFINYLTMILNSLMMVTFMLMNISRAKVSADRINEVLSTEVDIEDKPDTGDIQITRGEVTFESVTFRYEGAAGEPVLKNISFHVNPGEVVAILGPTGSGKSTLVSLIPRLYDVTEGRILIDGHDVRDYKLKTLRDGVSVVLQESILFSGSIKDNIRWGKEDATDEEVIQAARVAQAHDFISGFPEGYDTQLGQRGVNLSGGQKQRISIARAIVKKPPILILDDSTSAVDMATEYKIQTALKEVLKNTTCFVIAQRISSVMDADKIIVLDDGKIAGMGTHEELLRSNPIYQDICYSQLGKEAVVNG